MAVRYQAASTLTLMLIPAWPTSIPAGRPGEPEEVRGGQRQRRDWSPQSHVGAARQDRVSPRLPSGHRAGLALPC